MKRRLPLPVPVNRLVALQTVRTVLATTNYKNLGALANANPKSVHRL